MKKVLFVLVLVALVLMTVMPAYAQGGSSVSTGASIDPSGSPPVVKAKWELSPNDDPTRPGIQIIPNPSPLDQPGTSGQTDICVFAVVRDPNGIGDITDVYFKVFSSEHPYPTNWKYQIHMVKNLDGGAIDQGVATGQLTAAQAAELRTELEKHDAEMWSGCWVYHTHQVDGVYPIEVTAVDRAGNTGKLYNEILVESIVLLAMDFTGVDFGEIVPESEKWVMGDDTFGTSAYPTVWNRGNNPAGLNVRFSAMVGALEGKRIIDFNVKLFDQHEFLTVPNGADWTEWVRLMGPLMPCTPEQIDFSIHPRLGLPGDTYSGQIEIEMFDLDTALPS